MEEINDDKKRDALADVIDEPMSSDAWKELSKVCGWIGYICPVSEQHTFMNTEGKCAKCLSELQEKLLYYSLRFHKISFTEGWSAAVAYLQEVTQ